MKIISLLVDTRKPYNIEGIPLWLYVLMAILSFVMLFMGELVNSGMTGAFAVLWTIGFFFFALGERIRFFKAFLGGGLVVAYFGAALCANSGLISLEEVNYLQSHIIGNKLLYFILATLIVTSVLSVPVSILKKALLSFTPIILGGLCISVLLGVLAGMLSGVAIDEVIMMYFLPIMGGGTGAGAIPMSEVYADVTGSNATEYFNYAIGVLTLGNVVAILLASLLRLLGQKYRKLSGDGKLVKGQTDKQQSEPENENQGNTHAAMVFIVCILVTGVILSESIGLIHLFAWVTVIAIILNFTQVISPTMQTSFRKLNAWSLKAFLVIILVAFGLSADFNVISQLIYPGNLLIIISIVIGATLGSGVVSYFLRCYPLEGALAGGLCMANAGGSGDLQVLSAADRLELFPYAQISSRLGGAFMLILANYLFELFA